MVRDEADQFANLVFDLFGHDVTYDDKDCENGVAPVERANPQRRKKMLLAAIVFTFAVLALVIAYAAYVKSLDPVVTYAQKAAFQIGNSTFDHYTMTQNGAFRAACSDARGVVLNRDNAIISEFWPSTAGCVGVRMSEDGRKVWFVDSRGVLSEVNLEKDVGFAAKEIAELTDYLDFGFEVDRGVVRWFAPPCMLQWQIVLQLLFCKCPVTIVIITGT